MAVFGLALVGVARQRLRRRRRRKKSKRTARQRLQQWRRAQKWQELWRSLAIGRASMLSLSPCAVPLPPYFAPTANGRSLLAGARRARTQLALRGPVASRPRLLARSLASPAGAASASAAAHASAARIQVNRCGRCQRQRRRRRHCACLPSACCFKSSLHERARARRAGKAASPPARLRLLSSSVNSRPDGNGSGRRARGRKRRWATKRSCAGGGAATAAGAPADDNALRVTRDAAAASARQSQPTRLPARRAHHHCRYCPARRAGQRALSPPLRARPPARPPARQPASQPASLPARPPAISLLWGPRALSKLAAPRSALARGASPMTSVGKRASRRKRASTIRAQAQKPSSRPRAIERASERTARQAAGWAKSGAPRAPIDRLQLLSRSAPSRYNLVAQHCCGGLGACCGLAGPVY